MKTNRNIPRKKSLALQKTLAKNILFYRKNLNISQEELANRCGYHRTYIGSIERAERNITLATIEVFSTVFGISPQKLLEPKDE